MERPQGRHPPCAASHAIKCNEYHQSGRKLEYICLMDTSPYLDFCGCCSSRCHYLISGFHSGFQTSRPPAILPQTHRPRRACAAMSHLIVRKMVILMTRRGKRGKIGKEECSPIFFVCFIVGLGSFWPSRPGSVS